MPTYQYFPNNIEKLGFPISEADLFYGTRIGLYIVKLFIDQAGGSIEVTSKPIEGTKDYLTIFKMMISTWR